MACLLFIVMKCADATPVSWWWLALIFVVETLIFVVETLIFVVETVATADIPF